MKEISIAVVSLIVGAIIGPYINWGIEKKKQKLAYRRELVAKWRRMFFEIAERQVKTAEPLVHMLDLYEDFYSLKPHLTQDVLDRLGLTENLKGQAFETIIKSEALVSDVVYENRPLKNSSTFRLLQDEVGRIEKAWKLV